MNTEGNPYARIEYIDEDGITIDQVGRPNRKGISRKKILSPLKKSIYFPVVGF
jgi:hypothetical protein